MTTPKNHTTRTRERNSKSNKPASSTQQNASSTPAADQITVTRQRVDGTGPKVEVRLMDAINELAATMPANFYPTRESIALTLLAGGGVSNGKHIFLYPAPEKPAKPDRRTHTLVIESLRYLHAICTCGLWAITKLTFDSETDDYIRGRAKFHHDQHTAAEKARAPERLSQGDRRKPQHMPQQPIERRQADRRAWDTNLKEYQDKERRQKERRKPQPHKAANSDCTALVNNADCIEQMKPEEEKCLSCRQFYAELCGECYRHPQQEGHAATCSQAHPEPNDKLVMHLLAMANDAYFLGHPEWVEILKDVRALMVAEQKRTEGPLSMPWAEVEQLDAIINSNS